MGGVLEERRAFLRKELDQINAITISTIEDSRKAIEKLSRDFKRLNMKNDDFWRELPRPKEKRETTVPKLKTVETIDITKNLTQTKYPNKVSKNSACENLKKKYFYMWKELVDLRNTRSKILQTKTEQKEKLDDFIKHLKTWKKEHHVENKPEDNPTAKPRSSYKNRFNAQKVIIDMQRSKLDEQEKLIEELKLGIIKEDVLKSIDRSKCNIHELFSDCSEKLKCAMPMLLLEQHKFNLNIQKAPKVVQQMEQRALERARNREIILRRKQIAEETRQKLLEEAIEKKQVLEEEEKKRQLEVMKERRRRELEMDKIRQANKRRYMEGLEKAMQFHNNLLLKQCFLKLYKNMQKAREQDLIAREYHRRQMLKKYLNYWLAYYEGLYAIKVQIADNYFTNMIKRRAMTTWREYHKEEVRNMQVAEDYNDFRMTRNMFAMWHRYTCNQIILRTKNMKTAIKHYNRKIMFQFFYQWVSLKAVLELEKAKEKKKKKWREKVWEILPDFKPPEDF